ncbi:UNVERIFIED_ORG: hypothetical protein ABRZ91_001764 [Heyndrickxia coagulans]
MKHEQFETYTIREFMAGVHKIETPKTKMYSGLMGINLTGHSLFSGMAEPYTLILGAFGFAMVSTLIEHSLMSKGNERSAEKISDFTRFMLPMGVFSYAVYGVVTIL